MRTLDSKRYALGICAIAAILAGCGGSQSPIGAPGAVQPLGYQTQHAENIDAKATIKVLYSFKGSPDGAAPKTPLIAHTATDSMTTFQGGDSKNDGTVVGLTQKNGKWIESVLYTFKGYPTDGSEPTAHVGYPQGGGGLMTTGVGGTSNNGTFVAFHTSASTWTESFIYSFGGTPDGANPWGAVVADTAGNLYGTTEDGGTHYSGTVYRMQPKGSSYTESVLYNFGGGSSDGAHPLAGLIIDKKGALYGTAQEGGSAGAGAVFKLTPSKSGYTESILYSFKGVPDGSKPEAGVADIKIQGDAPGVLYGTTVYGGAKNEGTVYKLTSAGKGYKETVLWNFGTASGDGVDPSGGVCVDKKGVIYGTTVGGGSGGSSGLGTFFTLTPSGSSYKESVYSFTGANGAYPFAGPSVDTKDNLYVTTEAGGANNKGAVERFTATVKAAPRC
jgi:uncharacterized repeat protein (TIGR03803 family)